MSLSLQEIVRQHRAKIDHLLSYNQRKVLLDIATCGQPERGEIVMGCNNCNQQTRSWASCRNRHCNQCGHRANGLWLENQLETILPVPYAMVTFTIPSHLRSLFRYNDALAYDLQFRCSAEALSVAVKSHNQWGDDMAVGMAAFLHTWTQCLDYHPHIHVLIPLGGLDRSDETWTELEPKYLATYRIVSVLYRAKLCDALEKCYQRKQLKWPPDLTPFQNITAFKSWAKGNPKNHWRVDVSIPNGNTIGALDYMARYVNCTAIGNNRIKENDNHNVLVSYKNRKTNQCENLEITPINFLKRFVAHILPKGFTRVRWYGFLSCAQKRQSVNAIRDAICDQSPATSQKKLNTIVQNMLERLALRHCRKCEAGTMVFLRLHFNKFFNKSDRGRIFMRTDHPNFSEPPNGA